MDIVTAAIVFDTIRSVLGSAEDSYYETLKRKKDISYDDLRNAIQRAYYQASTKGNSTIEALTAKLANLQLVNRSPLLKKAVERASNKINKQIYGLRNELDDAELATNIVQQKIDRAIEQAGTAPDWSGYLPTKNKINKASHEALEGVKNVETKI